MKKIAFLISIILLFSIMIPSFALAQQACPGVSMYNYYGDYRKWAGTFGRNTVDEAGYPDYNVYVNSIYITRTVPPLNNMVEIGWFRDSGMGWYSKWFAAYSEYGRYARPWTESVGNDTNHNYEVRGLTGYSWSFRIDGVQRIRCGVQDFYYGYSTGAGERWNIYLGKNWAHWWYLQNMNSSTVWSSWQNMQPFYDSDTGAGYIKISNTEFKVR